MRHWIYEGFVILLLLLPLVFSHQGISHTEFIANCTAYPVEIRLTPMSLSSLTATNSDNIYISRMAVGNASTLPSPCVQSGANAQSAGFKLNITDCQPYITMNETYLFFSWTFRYIPVAQVILRYNESCINFTCAYNRTQLVWSGGISPTLQKILVKVNGLGDFSTSLKLFGDAAFSNKLAAGATVMVYSSIYVRVAIETAPVFSSRFIVQMKRCWAATTNSSTSTPQYQLITDSCSADLTHVNILRNYQPQNGTFNVSAFIWTTGENLPVFFFCDVTICDSADPGTNVSQPNCPTSKRRRRRDADADIGTRREILSYGPIIILPHQPPLKCSQDNGGCSDACSVKNDQVVCSCPLGSILGDDGKTCFEIREEYQEKTWVIGNDPLFIAALFMVGLTLLLSFVFFITRRKPASVKMIDQFEN